MVTVSDWLDALRASQRHLAGLLAGLDDSQLGLISGSSEWTVAQVASHLGSQAEIFGRFIESGLGRGAAPSAADFPAIWARWDALTPRRQAEDSIAANAEILVRLEEEGEGLGQLHLAMFGMEVDAPMLLRMRLSEMAVHTWDVEVALDPGAVVAPGAVDLLIDGLGQMVARAGQASAEPGVVEMITVDPGRRFLLDSNGVSLDALDSDAPAPARSVTLPAETLLRLVYGRVSVSHPPSGPVGERGVELSDLVGLFPGI